MIATIGIHQPKPEKVIRYALNNSISVKETLEQQLIAKGYHFLTHHRIGNYTFDFFCPHLKIAIEVDSYAHEFSDIYNLDAPKKLHIHSLGITVLRYTDHQILVDVEEIFRALKYHGKPATSATYVV